jgi:hypothetical protein
MWDMKFPHGKLELKRRYEWSFTDYDVIYKPNRATKIYLFNTRFSERILKYKIKKGETTYVIINYLKYDRDINITYAIKDNTCMKIDNPLDLKDFDIEKTL